MDAAGHRYLDRLVHNTYRIKLRGDSLRRPDPAADGAAPPTGTTGAAPPLSAEAGGRDYQQTIEKEVSFRG